MANPTPSRHRSSSIALAGALCSLALACVFSGAPRFQRQGWWSGLGPVVPHDTFPADCKLCHVGDGWNVLTHDFEFDHERETGVPLEGSHAHAQCLRCHNDRGPVATFAEQGCGGCHEDVHLGRLGALCADCHRQETWQPYGQVELHNQTRFPLIGVHAQTACRRCHPGAEIGQFVPTDIQCVTCHRDDLLNTTNPNHIGLGWVDNCQRCHLPTTWLQAL